MEWQIRSACRNALAILALGMTVAAVYLQVEGHSFLPYDDELYVTSNDVVRRGLTREGILWAFTTFHAGNWHPLAWLSHMSDIELFGVDAGWHLRVNVLLHALNSAMLFLVLQGMTREFWKSAVVAALFAVHPLHVESVAWVSERKDVLSAFFFLGTIRAYTAYVRRPRAIRYLAVFGLLALGLMAKPMLVTLPFVLLLLDYWPLGRWGSSAPRHRLIWEKIPLLALSAASCVVTYLAQKSGRAIVGGAILPLGIRVANAIVAYGEYLVKMAWPSALSAIYPHPAYGHGIVFWKAALAAGFLLLSTAVAVVQARRRPCLAAGWFWYLGTLVPVIGLVQVGVQSMADRYTYIPLIGVFVFIVWGIAGIRREDARWIKLCALAAAAWLSVLGWLAWRQVGHWKDGIALFSHALELHPGNPEARENLGTAHNNMGMQQLSLGNVPEAATHFREALRLAPGDVTVLLNLGAAEATLGNIDEAIRLFRQAEDIRPGDARARHNLERAFQLRRQRGSGGPMPPEPDAAGSDVPGPAR